MDKYDLKKVEVELEKQLGKYLDTRYKFDYARVNSSSKTDEILQLSGVDIIQKNKLDKPIFIDEKARLSCINSDNVDTFVFELDFINKANKHTQGWFFAPNYLTNQYYLITKITTSNVDDTKKHIYNIVYNNKNFNGIITFRNALIRTLNRIEFQNMLKQKKLDKNRISRHYRHKTRSIINYLNKNENLPNIFEIVKQNLEAIDGVTKVYFVTESDKFTQELKLKGIKIYIKELENNTGWIHYTHYLSEKPINLLIKDKLIDCTTSTASIL